MLDVSLSDSDSIGPLRLLGATLGVLEELALRGELFPLEAAPDEGAGADNWPPNVLWDTDCAE